MNTFSKVICGICITAAIGVVGYTMIETSKAIMMIKQSMDALSDETLKSESREIEKLVDARKDL